jgi:hypothetical protein
MLSIMYCERVGEGGCDTGVHRRSRRVLSTYLILNKVQELGELACRSRTKIIELLHPFLGSLGAQQKV